MYIVWSVGRAERTEEPLASTVSGNSSNRKKTKIFQLERWNAGKCQIIVDLIYAKMEQSQFGECCLPPTAPAPQPRESSD